MMTRVLLQLIVLHVSCAAGDNGLFNVTQVPEAVLMRGVSAVLYCIYPIFSDNRPFKVHWWRDGDNRFLDESADKRIQFYFLRRGSAVLRLGDVTAKDAGLYFCSLTRTNVFNGTGTKLVVYDTPTPLSLTTMLPENTSVTLILVCKTATFFPLDLNITWYKNGSDIIQNLEPNKTQTTAGLYEAWSSLTETDHVESGTVYTCQVSHISLPHPTNISYTFYSRVSLPDNPFHNWIFGCVGAGLIPLIIIIFIVKRKGTCRTSKGRAEHTTKTKHWEPNEGIVYSTFLIADAKRSAEDKYAEPSTIYAQTMQSECDPKLTYTTLNIARLETSIKSRYVEEGMIYAQTIHGRPERMAEEIDINTGNINKIVKS